MHKFDKLILESMVNTESMLVARKKVLEQKRKAGFNVTAEVKRAGRFLERYQGFMRDWQYWYYDDIAGTGDPGPKKDERKSSSPLAGVDVIVHQKLASWILPTFPHVELELDKDIKKSGY